MEVKLSASWVDESMAKLREAALNRFSLEGRTALITGASGLLGVEHAEALLEIGSGVILTDIDENGLSNACRHLKNKYAESKVTGLPMDVTCEASVASVLAESETKVDILINNAAIDPKVKDTSIVDTSRLENLLLDDWNFQLNVGLTGAMLCSKIFGAAMAREGGGVILNIASDLSVFSPDQRLYEIDGLSSAEQPVKPVTYSVIKHGMIGLTKYLATYWCAQGVRCNALSPGGVLNGQNGDFIERLTSLIPLNRMAAKHEYRSAVQFLCSDASSYMTGQNVVIDGGRSVW